MAEDIKKVIKNIMGEAQDEPQQRRSLIPYLMTANEILRSNIPQKKYLLSSFIPSSSFGMVFAPRGIGKSWFALGLAKAIATGVDTFLGWQVHEKGDVLFIDGEMSLVDLKERTQLLFGEKGSDKFHIMPSEQLYQNGNPICLDMPQEHDAILQLLEHMDELDKRPKLIILDNLSTLRRGVNENDNSEAERLLSFLIKLRHMGYAVLVVHHTNKVGQQRGASIIEVPMDFILKLNHPEKGEAAFSNGACFKVELPKNRNKDPRNKDFICELKEQEDGTIEFLVNTSLSEVPHEMVLLRAIAECDVKPTVRLFANRINISNGKVDKLLKILRKNGAIGSNDYIIGTRGSCMLHEWFAQNYPEPDSYKAYQAEIPF